MKIVIALSSFLIRFAVVSVDVEAFAFQTFSVGSGVGSRYSRGIHRCNTNHYHHLGDLEHDALLPGNAGDNHQVAVVFDTVEVALDDTAREAAMKFVVALWVACSLALVGFGGGVGSSSSSSTISLFQPRPAFAFDFDTTVVVAGGSSVKDSDIVDFSMPSYEAAARSEVNSNLKGDKYLLGEASKNYDSGSTSSSSSNVEEKSSAPAAPIVDEKTQKAEAKAALKAARARQQAEIEANIKAKSEAAAAEAAAPPASAAAESDADAGSAPALASD